MKKVIYTKKAPEPIGPYSQAILHGDTLYISGQIPLDPTDESVVKESVAEQTHQVMKNIASILDAAGFGFNNVVKCSIFVTDLKKFNIVNETYGTYFDDNPPARETVQVTRLPKDVQVEISCIAVK